MYVAPICIHVHIHVHICISPDHHSSKLNLTSRLAVKIKNLPGFEFDWADTTPQRLWTSLNVEDILPSKADATVLHQQAACALHDWIPGGDILESQTPCGICS